MLEELQVSNLGVIRDARIQFGSGMHIVTGETGAGKTLIVEALGLVAGARADPTVVGPDADEAVIEAMLSNVDAAEWAEPGDNLVLRRVISATGRSRAYINGRMASLAQLRELGENLIAINGQNGAIGLLTSSGQLEALDRFGGSKIAALCDDYAVAYDRLKAANGALERLGGDPRELARDADLLSYQVHEIEAAEIQEGEDAALLEEAARLSSVAELREAAMGAREAAEQAADGLARSGSALAGAIAGSEVGPMIERSNGLATEAADLASDLRRYLESLEEDPERLKWVEVRLDLLAGLKRKYGPTIGDVVAFAESARLKLAELNGLHGSREAAEEEYAAALDAAGLAASSLSAARAEVSGQLAIAVKAHLRELELSGATFEIAVESGDVTDPGAFVATGIDSTTFFFSANEGIDAKPAARIASGGELSRLMLAIELAISSGTREIAMVFDEIDAGIGGVAATAVAEKLAALADDVQVLCVTHLPQVASRAEHHYLVSKSGGRAEVSELGESERRDEISRMLAGEPESEHALRHASELIEAADTNRQVRRASIESRG